MHLVDEQAFSIELMDEGTQTTLPRSRICLDGKPTDAIIAGAIFEACIKIEKLYLVFTTDDCPFEEGLNICLLDENLLLLDAMVLSHIYTTATFRLHELKAPDRVVFEFLGDKLWEVCVFQTPRFRLPYIDPIGVSRKPGFKSYLQIAKCL